MEIQSEYDSNSHYDAPEIVQAVKSLSASIQDIENGRTYSFEQVFQKLVDLNNP